MKCLIVEDDFTARKLLHVYLSDYFDCFVAVNGFEGLQAFKVALYEGQPYDLICLDIMMPEMNGHDVLKSIREIENERDICGLDGVKVIMITSLEDSKNIMDAFREGCESYIIKPVKKNKLFKEIEKLGLLQKT